VHVVDAAYVADEGFDVTVLDVDFFFFGIALVFTESVLSSVALVAHKVDVGWEVFAFVFDLVLAILVISICIILIL
jgi:hypothetical protein